MAKFAKGKYALAISDRSGLAFPWRQMVTEWNGAFVHVSEYEPKQPQLEPKPFVADPQGLEQARPARTEFPTEDFLPKNPFTTAAADATVSVAFENGDMSVNDIFRLRDIKSPVGGVDPDTLQVSGMVLQGDITSTATTITLDYTSDMPTSGYIVIEKVNSTTGQYENEVVQYTGISGINLTGCIRGTSAQYRGVAPKLTTATSHKSGAKVFGAFKITALNTRTQNNPGMPATTTIQTGFNFELASNAPASAKGGGFQCTIGPINDRG
jgi:hypothetical protein